MPEAMADQGQGRKGIDVERSSSRAGTRLRKDEAMMRASVKIQDARLLINPSGNRDLRTVQGVDG